jgi:O-antigen ligase
MLSSVKLTAVSSTYASLSTFPSGTLQLLLLIAAYIAVFLLVRELMWFFSDRPWVLVLPLVLIATSEAVIGITQSWSGAADPIIRGTFANRNHFAGLLELGLPFAVAYPLSLLQQRERGMDIGISSLIRICASFAIAATLLVAITFSLSRMGFIAALSSLLVMGIVAVLASRTTTFFASRAAKTGAIAILILGVLVTFVILPPNELIERFAQISSNEESSEGRAGLWKETASLIHAYPIFGCGLGAFESAFPKYKVSGPMFTDDYAHNDFLQVLAEMGIVGALILFLPAAAAVRRAFGCALHSADPALRTLGLACAGSLTAIIMHSTADFNLSIPSNAMTVAWIVGIVTALPYKPSAGSVPSMSYI